jgi:hypothetical protein
MSSFGGVSFIVTNEAFRESAPGRVSVRAFPGGNNWAISLAGQSAVERSIQCLFTDRGQYVSLVLLRGTQQTLFVDFWDTNGIAAVLKNVEASQMFGDGQVLAKADFVLV